jgi:hypothetical protein
VAMFPHERSLVQKMQGRPFVIIGVNSDRNREECQKKNDEQGITWRSFWCGEAGTGGPIPRDWGVTGWPTLYLIDHHGVIRRQSVGAPENEAMDSAIEDLVKKAEGDANKKGGN